MKKFPFLILLLMGLILAGLSPIIGIDRGQAAALPQPTPFKTPTPGEDGRIFYTVQDQDTLWSIAAIAGVSVDELRGMNNMHPEENIRPGQQILLGMAGPALYTATPGPTQPLPTATVTATPESGTGELWILLFDDLNGDSLRQETEPVIPNGAISVTEKDNRYNKSENTVAGMDPNGFVDIPPGEYTISVAIPEGYNPTTATNYTVQIKAGDQTYVDFGAQSKEGGTPDVSSEAPENNAAPGNTTPILGVMGIFFLLVGVGLGVYATRLRR